MNRPRNVAILVFDDVEMLDFCGPFEVFSFTGWGRKQNPFQVYPVAEHLGPIPKGYGLRINPRYTFADCPPPDILIVPGGQGTRREMHNQILIDWIKKSAAKAELVISVCTGALLLAKAGLLDGLAATTRHGTMDLLLEVAPRTATQPEKRFVDNGRVMTSVGIRAGIDLSFHAIAKLLGDEAAKETARHIEYNWNPQ